MEKLVDLEFDMNLTFSISDYFPYDYDEDDIADYIKEAKDLLRQIILRAITRETAYDIYFDK